MRQLLVVTLAGAAISMAAAVQSADTPERNVELKDGSSLHVYKDGKMSMQDGRGRPLTMKDGMKMETKGGQVIMMRGNEVWRQIRPNQIGD